MDRKLVDLGDLAQLYRVHSTFPAFLLGNPRLVAPEHLGDVGLGQAGILARLPQGLQEGLVGWLLLGSRDHRRGDRPRRTGRQVDRRRTLDPGTEYYGSAYRDWVDHTFALERWNPPPTDHAEGNYRRRSSFRPPLRSTTSAALLLCACADAPPPEQFEHFPTEEEVATWTVDAQRAREKAIALMDDEPDGSPGSRSRRSSVTGRKSGASPRRASSRADGTSRTTRETAN